MRALMFAIPDSARVILVGDADQLPSIGPGCVLRDIIESNCIHVTRLEEIFRQSKDSVIVENAHRINKGIEPLMDNSYSDFKLVTRNKKSDIVSTIVKLCVETIPEKYGFTADDIQVLSPNTKQEDGVHNLNKLLQAQINPPDRFKKEKVAGQEILRVGDRVMQIRNNYQLAWRKYFSHSDYEEGEGVFNGDMGKIERIYDDVVTVRFDDDRVVEYDAVGIEDIVNAYAISIHKSQGCEFPCVVIPISYGTPFLYNRNLLYTAVTRAKELVVLVGTAEAVNRMVQNISMQRRYSRLSYRIKTEFGV
jgi:exodeoxyribonuclease V alpha subunit